MKMKSSNIYFIFCIIWLALCIFVLPLTGEAGILPILLTALFTAPLGIILEFFYVKIIALSGLNALGGETVSIICIILSLFLNYFQWLFFIKTFRKLKEKYLKKKS